MVLSTNTKAKTMSTLDLSVSNPKLTRVQSIRSQGKKRAEILNHTLPVDLREPLLAFYRAIFGETKADNEIVSLVVTFDDDGSFKRMYSPSIVSNADEVAVLSWGNDSIPLADVTIEADFDLLKINGYDEICLVLELDGVALPCLIRKKDKDATIRDLRAAFKKGELGSMLMALGGGGNGRPMTDVRALEQGVTYFVTGAKKVKTSYGASYILDIDANPEFGLPEPVSAWSHNSINNILEAGAIVTPEQPASLTYHRYEHKDGKPRHKFIFECAWPEEDDSFELSWS